MIDNLRERVSGFFSDQKAKVDARIDNANQARKRKSRQLRLRMSISALVVLVGVSLLCSMTGISMLSLPKETCSPLASYQFYVPPLLLLVGSILGPILFFLRRPMKWVVMTTLLFYFMGLLLYIAWYPLVSTMC